MSGVKRSSMKLIRAGYVACMRKNEDLCLSIEVDWSDNKYSCDANVPASPSFMTSMDSSMSTSVKVPEAQKHPDRSVPYQIIGLLPSLCIVQLFSLPQLSRELSIMSGAETITNEATGKPLTAKSQVLNTGAAIGQVRQNPFPSCFIALIG